jgi:hypothetical protein
MTIKGVAIRTIQQLPEDATWKDIQERINFRAGCKKGFANSMKERVLLITG